VLFVDGAKFTESRWSDLLNFRRLTRPGAALFYDEVAGSVNQVLARAFAPRISAALVK